METRIGKEIMMEKDEIKVDVSGRKDEYNTHDRV